MPRTEPTRAVSVPPISISMLRGFILAIELFSIFKRLNVRYCDIINITPINKEEKMIPRSPLRAPDIAEQTSPAMGRIK